MEVVVTYRIKPERVAEDRLLLRALYRELSSIQPDWLASRTFVDADGLTMLFQLVTEHWARLAELERMTAYRTALDGRCSRGPVTTVRDWDSVSTARLTRLGLWNPICGVGAVPRADRTGGHRPHVEAVEAAEG